MTLDGDSASAHLVGRRTMRLGLPGIWIALGLWLAARAVLLGRRWRARPAS